MGVRTRVRALRPSRSSRRTLQSPLCSFCHYKPTFPMWVHREVLSSRKWKDQLVKDLLRTLSFRNWDTWSSLLFFLLFFFFFLFVFSSFCLFITLVFGRLRIVKVHTNGSNKCIDNRSGHWRVHVIRADVVGTGMTRQVTARKPCPWAWEVGVKGGGLLFVCEGPRKKVSALSPKAIFTLFFF